MPALSVLMDSETEEVFEDAHDYSGNTRRMDLDTALAETKSAVNFVLNNQFEEAKNIFRPWVGKSMYHTLGDSALQFIEAVLTLEKPAVEKAIVALKNCIDLINRNRKKGALPQSIRTTFKNSRSEQFTAEEIHAELCYTEALLFKSLLSFIEGNNFVNLIKGCFKIRSCYKYYKECSAILESHDVPDEEHMVHFRSGVHAGMGAFNLMIAQLPDRVKELLGFIGMSGSKELGLTELIEGYKLKEGLRRVLSVLALLTYNLFVVFHSSHEEGDLKLCKEILKEELQVHPSSAWFLFLKGRLQFMRGNINKANKWYVRSWNSQNVWVQFHHSCFWEMMWTNCTLLQWREAAGFASNLLAENKWFRNIYAYHKLSCLLMLDKVTDQERKEVDELLNLIPKSRQRIAGKVIPVEQFNILRCRRCIAQNKFLVLPAIELLYLWNFFKVLRKKPILCNTVHNLVVESLGEFESGKHDDTQFRYDNQCLLLLLRGACLRNMKSHHRAEMCFKTVITWEKRIQEDKFLVPYSMVELAFLYAGQGLIAEAIKLLQDAKKNYAGYSLESRLQYRIHSALLDFTNRKNRSVSP